MIILLHVQLKMAMNCIQIVRMFTKGKYSVNESLTGHRILSFN